MSSKRIQGLAVAIALSTFACGESSSLTRWQAPENTQAPSNMTPNSHLAPFVVSTEPAGASNAPTRIAAPQGPPPSPPSKSTATGPHISQAECATMIDHYIELTIRGAPGMANLGPDEIQAAKEMAKDAVVADPSYQKAASQCEHDVTHAKFDCAMGSTSTAAWQSCVK
jgi:hypothetical protein